MKKYEEFTDAADVLTSGIQPLLEKKIRDLRDPLMVGAQLLGVDTDLVRSPGGIKRYRLEKTRMVAEDFNESADIPDISVADPDEYTDKTPTYFGGGDPITGQAIGDADYNAIKRSLTRIARAMAIKSDARIWEEILDSTLKVDEAIAGGGTDFDLLHGDNTVPGEAILHVVSITTTTSPAPTWTLDYINGNIDFSADPGASTITYVWGSVNRTYIRVATPKTLDYSDIVKAKTQIRSAFVTADTLVVDEFSEEQLLNDDKFLDASAYGEKVVLNGEIGKVIGMNVITTDTLYDNVPVVLKRGPELGVMCFKVQMKSDIQKVDRRPGDTWVQAYEKSIPVVLKPDWIRILINAQVFAVDE